MDQEIKFFYIFSLEEKFKDKINGGNFINKSLSDIKKAQRKALIKSFKKNKIPFREFIIKEHNENVLGKLISYFMLETVLIGKLLKLNPFNQPAVEQVKIFTKTFLK